MSIFGLGNEKKSFVYLDDYIEITVSWESLHNEISYGIAKSEWSKKYVSSGVHQDWADKEITPLMRRAEQVLTLEQKLLMRSLQTTDEKLKFMAALKDVPHPFWLLYLRNNKRVEYSGIANKAVQADCEWTNNAKYFPKLVSFIKSLPFAEIGRVVFFMTEPNNDLVPHYDAADTAQRNTKKPDDFIWFTTKPGTKRMFVMDGETKERYYADSSKKFVWWNEMDYHGTEAVSHFAFSIRIDGKFKPEITEALLG
jgi:hypothetical protein